MIITASDLNLQSVLLRDSSTVLVGRTPVTRGLWGLVMGYGRLRMFIHLLRGRPSLPMTGISYHDVNDFLLVLSRRTGNTFSLPTGEEWREIADEYTVYPGTDDVDRAAWYEGNTRKLRPVGMKCISRKGLYDLSGNVHEMTLGTKHSHTILCLGGSYKSNWARCKPPVCGHHISKSEVADDVGFRIISRGLE